MLAYVFSLILLISSIEAKVKEECGFLYDGTLHTSMLFTETNVKVIINTWLFCEIIFLTLKVELVTALANCQLRALLIGGGGWNFIGCMSSGGGGSGYLQYHTQAISGNSEIQLMVGTDRQPYHD